MIDLTSIKEHAKMIGADAVHVGTVDHVAKGPDGGERIKLVKADSGEGSHRGHLHHISQGLLAAVDEDGTVRLSASGAIAVLFEEQEDEG